MSTFDDRERAEEARYAFDQETQFKVMARRNKLLGLWAADLMGLTGSDAEAYSRTDGRTAAGCARTDSQGLKVA